MKGIMIILLCALPVAAIGFFGGMCYMRSCYRQILRQNRQQIRWHQRHTRIVAKSVANSAYIAGYRDFLNRNEKNEI